MIDKKRDIFIKVEKIDEIVEILDLIKKQKEETKKLFIAYEKLNSMENKVFENWNNYLDDTLQKLDHITL